MSFSFLFSSARPRCAGNTCIADVYLEFTLKRLRLLLIDFNKHVTTQFYSIRATPTLYADAV